MLDSASAGLDGERQSARIGEIAAYLHCPRCRLCIRRRAISLHGVHCPRCVARSRTPVELVASPRPAERLHGG